MKLGMLAAAVVSRIEEHRRGRIGATERPVVAHTGPQAAGARLALGQRRYRGVVGMNALGREHVGADRLDHRHQGCGRSTHPVGKRRDIELNTFPPVSHALAVERQIRGG
jgi:hypothetical protein